MQNITEILKEIGIEVPEDKLPDLIKKVAENYKTVAEMEKKTGRLEQERDDYKSQLESAKNTLKGFEGIDLSTMRTQLAEYKEKAEKAEKDFKDKLAERDLDDALNAALDGIKFTSETAKRGVKSRLKEERIELNKDGKLRGFDSLISKLREEDKDAFAEDSKPSARFTSSFGKNDGVKKYSSIEDIYKIKDATERQTAIAQNMDLFRKDE